MLHAQYQDLVSQGVAFGIDASLTVSAFSTQCAVDGYIALPLTFVSPRYAANEVYSINLPYPATISSHLLTCKNLPFLFSQASNLLAAAFLCDVTPSEATSQNLANYTFKNDYLVLETSHLALYLSDYKEGSAIWGGFSHDVAPPAFSPIPAGKVIYGAKLLTLPSTEHTDALLRANRDPSALGRFLGLYHL